MPELRFRTNAKVERLIGRELITNNKIAIFEIIKNSYDAGAKKVEITFRNFLPFRDNNGTIVSDKRSYIKVCDNGKGMTLDEIKEYWMELGTPNKEKNRVEHFRVRDSQIESIARRVNGEKGIGRFGVDKIGSSLIMDSIDRHLSMRTIVKFNWEHFNNTNKLIEEVPCKYKIRNVPLGAHSGLSLKIKNLRDLWSQRDIIALKRSLRKFLSPIQAENDEFKILFHYEYKEDGKVVRDSEELINDTFDYLKTNISTTLDINGNGFYEVYDKDEIVEEKNFNFESKHPFGAVELRIFYLDRYDKSIFSKKVGLTTREYGNIKIFRENFRILPYGESHNDWLEIDNKHAQGVFRTFATRDVIGYILLSYDPEKGNSGLRDATDRVGLIEDVPEFDELKNFVWMSIKILQEYVFNREKARAKEAVNILKIESASLKDDVVQMVSSFKNFVDKTEMPKTEKKMFYKELSTYGDELLRKADVVDNASKELDKKITVFAQITAKEGILYDMLHTIKNKLAVINAQIRGFSYQLDKLNVSISTTELDIAFQSISKLVEGALNKVNTSRLRKIIVPIDKVIQDVVDSYKPRLHEEKIEVLTILKTQEIMIRCNPEILKNNIFENLLDNSVKALQSINSKKIIIETEVDNSYVNIFFSDNGVGIIESKVPFIFSLWSSNTDGTGIGLATVKDSIEDMDGQIDYVELDDTNKKTTFRIRIPIIKNVGD